MWVFGKKQALSDSGSVYGDGVWNIDVYGDGVASAFVRRAKTLPRPEVWISFPDTQDNYCFIMWW